MGPRGRGGDGTFCGLAVPPLQCPQGAVLGGGGQTCLGARSRLQEGEDLSPQVGVVPNRGHGQKRVHTFSSPPVGSPDEPGCGEPLTAESDQPRNPQASWSRAGTPKHLIRSGPDGQRGACWSQVQQQHRARGCRGTRALGAGQHPPAPRELSEPLGHASPRVSADSRWCRRLPGEALAFPLRAAPTEQTGNRKTATEVSVRVWAGAGHTGRVLTGDTRLRGRPGDFSHNSAPSKGCASRPVRNSSFPAARGTRPLRHPPASSGELCLPRLSGGHCRPSPPLCASSLESIHPGREDLLALHLGGKSSC